MGRYKDITGQRFGKLTVLDEKAKCKGHVVCVCDCGNVKEIRKADIVAGKIKTCGSKGCRLGRWRKLDDADVQHTQNTREIHTDYSSNKIIDKSFENEERVIDINKVYKKMYEISKKPSISKKNSSGYTGVVWNKKNKRWIAGIGFKGEHIHLGSFQIFDKAVRARKEAEELLFAPAVISRRKIENAI